MKIKCVIGKEVQYIFPCGHVDGFFPRESIIVEHFFSCRCEINVILAEYFPWL